MSGREYYQLIQSDLEGIKRTVNVIERHLKEIRAEENVAVIKGRIAALVQETEKLVLKGRSIPIIRLPKEAPMEDEYMQYVKIMSSDEVIFFEMPLLIPKTKFNRAGKDYLVSTLHSVFKAHFSVYGRLRYEEPVVIWFEHVYQRKEGRNPMRDHDNVETKIVKDLLTPYIMADDCPLYCSDLCTSRFGDRDKTCIHVVPVNIFPDYFRKRAEQYAEFA